MILAFLDSSFSNKHRRFVNADDIKFGLYKKDNALCLYDGKYWNEIVSNSSNICATIEETNDNIFNIIFRTINNKNAPYIRNVDFALNRLYYRMCYNDEIEEI